MEENYVSRTQVTAALAWAVVAGLMGGGVAVLVLAPDRWAWALLLTAGSCATSAVAATLTIKGYAVRLCSVIRATAGLERPEGPNGGDLRLMR